MRADVCGQIENRIAAGFVRPDEPRIDRGLGAVIAFKSDSDGANLPEIQDSAGLLEVIRERDLRNFNEFCGQREISRAGDYWRDDRTDAKTFE